MKYINGSISPVGLFCALYKHRKTNQIIVLDDADDILFKQDAINVLKCAIDTTEGREVTWEKFSNTLLLEGVPKQFVFEGKIVIISNLDLGEMHKKKTKINLHLRALADRCHHLDISNLSIEDKINRIRHLVFEHDMFKQYQVNYARKQLMDWIVEKQHSLKAVNLRTALKVAEIYKQNKNEWKQLAEDTLC